jgi:peptide/nickel transport system permease protein
VLVSCYAGLAGLSRFMRVGMVEIIRSDFIRTARAKGCNERTVILRHALRNSLIPLITLLAGMLPGLIGGSVIIETIFGIPGMGWLGYNAVLQRDYTVLMANFTLSAVLTLLGILMSDILYVIVDPRISFDKGAT